MTYFLPFWLARKAFDITLTMTYGAGMFAIAGDDYIVVRPMVNYWKSPSMQALMNVWVDSDDLTENQMVAKVRQLPQQIMEWFEVGKAHWNDIDLWGSGLLHYTIYGFLTNSEGDPLAHALCAETIEQLLNMGVPLDTRNVYNRSALDQIFSCMRSGYSRAGMVEACLLGRGIEPTSYVPTFSTMEPWTFVGYLRDYPEIMEDLNIGLIGVAIIERSTSSLEKQLRRASFASINEQYLRKQSPLHLSADWPTGLKLLLNAGANIDLCDEQGYLPVHYAIKQGHDDCVRLFIDAGCALPYQITRNELLLPVVQQSCSPELTLIIIRAIAERHEDLRKLAIMRAKETIKDEAERKSLIEDIQYDAVFDQNSQAIAFSEGLFDEAYPLPARLRLLGPPTAYNRRPESGRLHVSRGSVQLADMLYAEGFMSLACHDSFGFTPFLEACSIGDLPMMKWFIEHKKGIYSLYESGMQYDHDSASDSSDDVASSDSSGVWSKIHNTPYQPTAGSPTPFPLPPPELLQGSEALNASAGSMETTIRDKTMIIADRLKDRTGISALHLYCDYVSQNSGREYWGLVLGFHLLEPTGLLACFSLADQCTCFCSPRGCTPSSMMARSYDRGIPVEQHRKKLKTVASLLEQVLAVRAAMLREAYHSLTRVELFERLGMRHTCCQVKEYGIASMSYHEQREFQEEDARSNNILDKWMAAFESLAVKESPRRACIKVLRFFPEREPPQQGLASHKVKEYYAHGSVTIKHQRYGRISQELFDPEMAQLLRGLPKGSIARKNAAMDTWIAQEVARLKLSHPTHLEEDNPEDQL